jgi:hypothetical protein
MSEIWKKHRELQKERRDLITKLMEPHEEYFRARAKELMELCEKEGHNFKFTNLGPLGHAWFHCSKCGKSKVEGFDE